MWNFNYVKELLPSTHFYINKLSILDFSQL